MLQPEPTFAVSALQQAAGNAASKLDQLKAAFALHLQGQLQQAAALYLEILASEMCEPGVERYDVLQLLATIAAQCKDYANAVILCDQSLAIQPQQANVYNIRGFALNNLGCFIAALASYERAIELQPDHVDAHNNRANVLRDLKRPIEALRSFEQALRIKPDQADVHMNESQCRLLLGDFVLGWQKYEWRWQAQHLINSTRAFAQPLWLGQEDLQGKTILLHGEQGYGDTIQFCRYVAQVAALGATVILEVQAPLQTLMRELVGVALLLSRGERLPEFDFHCPLMSLALAFQADLKRISGASYLHGDPSKCAFWAAKLHSSHKKRVGLAWSGSGEHANDVNRSIGLCQLIGPLLLGANQLIDFYCLQTELPAADLAVLEKCQSCRFFGSELLDFSDTAALLDQMDLVITVDTCIAHLAGAMGKPVWILLPFNSDWRWLLNRRDSPWYDSARLFRQPRHGDWASLLAQVAAALKA